jgi:hypothetical protein
MRALRGVPVVVGLLITAVLLVPALALAECGGSHGAQPPAATIAQEPAKATGTAACPATDPGCRPATPAPDAKRDGPAAPAGPATVAATCQTSGKGC